MREVKLLIVEGLDRTGKDTLCYNLHQKTMALFVPWNKFEAVINPDYYEVTRNMMRSEDSGFVSAVTSSMAVTEFMQLLAYIKSYDDLNEFVVSRAFPSTIVFDFIRGIINEHTVSTIKEMIRIFERDNDIKIDMRLFMMFISRDHMMARGSKPDSFEIKNFDEISITYHRYFEKQQYLSVFSKCRRIQVNDLSEDSVFESARTFLFTD